MFPSDAARHRPGTALVRLVTVLVVAAALVVAPVAGRTPVAVAATTTAFTDVPATAAVGAPYTFGGTVTDESPVAAVEVSTDAGVTWRAAGWQAGQTTWSHTFTPANSGTAHLRVRALDAAQSPFSAASAETPVAARVCPCGLWSDADAPATADATDNTAVELGLKWRSTSDGHVRGIRFYKGPGNTGTHTGTLWSATGTALATGTFRAETASGWQTLVFAQPVAVTGNTTYTASYLSPTGHFSVDQGYFARSSRYLEPLTGLQTGVDGPNGVYRTGGGFPNTGSPGNANYWVDVVWAPEPGADGRAPDLIGTTPTGGAGSVALTAPVSAAFDETIAPGSAQFTVTGPAGPVTGRTSLSGNAKTAQFAPDGPLPAGTAFTASVRVGDAAGNQTAQHTWQFTTGTPRAAECPCTLWDDFTTPAVTAADDSRPVELGVKVRFAGKGQVLGVRFYKGAGNTGTHTGSFWTSTGVLLATGTFTGETTTGWQTLTFAEPVSVQTGTTYVVSYFAPDGHYAVTQKQFQDQPTTYGPITAITDGTAGANGLFRYDGGFPTGGYLASNYWVDVVYRNGLNGDTDRPTLDTRTPGPDATGVALDQPVTLGFSEAIDPESAVVTFSDTGGGTLSGTSTLSADQKTVTWTPNGTYKPATRYAVRVQAADVNGNTMTAPVSWSITTQATAPCPCSLFSDATVPKIPSANDGGAYELGVRFTVPRGGWVTSVRFYKGEGNNGTHTGSLWNSSGQRIAHGTFTDETAIGWQELTFAEPVAIAHGATYVASYSAPQGHYSIDHGYFTFRNPVVSPPLGTAEGVAAGVFAPGGGYPSLTWNGNNYWVDVDFTPYTDFTPPVHTGHTPGDGAVDVGLSGPLHITYDEPLNVADSTVRVKDSHGVTMRGTLSLTDGNRTLVWTPVAPLVRGTTYTASARAADSSENIAVDTVTWSFTMGNPPCPCSLYSEAAVPEIAEFGYYGGAGIGVRFIPSTNGSITAVKFYKGPANRRYHHGYLSLPNQETLASGGFADETPSGWQTVTFANPVPVTAGTEYLAWYTMLDGRYSQTTNYFRNGGTVTPQLTAPGGPDSYNGMFGRIQGYPSFPRDATYNNYWVDVVFTTS
ncbi:DUF4082 domain-containing protein [Actinosynnema sp. NPDC047251]|uniref:DUF4082 domain-containing protein n=1 Tax=Saccharothrix espanaensis (strain ATCC 51144 / DSM 44229 / JCM 9112 / NBRC 15066 / NRRL 15764) TaxID=1179773 RepID=K0K2Z1_SACES|nr:DUF4082 domain-containing protein [Saccharothrix espanaensis]CCH31244.1 hypothetical protein BN6_39560 [Saccharothrix espanaensis DSM 44229]